MIYVADVNTPADTSYDDRIHTLLSITKGLVYKVEIDFPAGSAGLLHCQIFDGGFQLWPTSPRLSFHSPGFVISFEDTYLKNYAPFSFEVYTWNLDDTYDHFLQVRIGLISEQAFMARFMPNMVYDDMLKVLSKVEIQQEADREAIIADPFGTNNEGE